MNDEKMKAIALSEIEQVSGGVIEGPDGQGCTDPTEPIGMPVPDLGPPGPTIEIDPSI